MERLKQYDVLLISITITYVLSCLFVLLVVHQPLVFFLSILLITIYFMWFTRQFVHQYRKSHQYNGK